MSKNKPKETIEYVIRLQDKERQILDDFVMSKNVNLVSGYHAGYGWNLC